MAAFDAAGSDEVFGAAVHPQDYYLDNQGPMDAWFDFLESRDPDGSRSRTAGAILQDHVDSVQALPSTSVGSVIGQVGFLIVTGIASLRDRTRPRRSRRHDVSTSDSGA